MKRFLPFFPLIFLFFLNACGELTAEISPAEWTAVWRTNTASVWTPTITPTPDPDEKKIVDWLNEVLSQADELERTLDAKYYVLDVYFQPIHTARIGSFRSMRVANARSTCNVVLPNVRLWSLSTP